MSAPSQSRALEVQALMQYARDPSSVELKDIPRLLGEVERLRGELLSALCSVAAAPRVTPSRDTSFLTVAEVANRLKLSRGHVYELVRSGRLAAIRTGRAVRVPAEELNELQPRHAAKAVAIDDSVALSSTRDGRNGQTHPQSPGAHPAGVRGAAGRPQGYRRQVGDRRATDPAPHGQAHRTSRGIGNRGLSTPESRESEAEAH